MNPLKSITDILNHYQMRQQLGADPRLLSEAEQQMLGTSSGSADDLRRIALGRAQQIADSGNPDIERQLFGGFLSQAVLGNPVAGLRANPTAAEAAEGNRDAAMRMAPQAVQQGRNALLKALGGR